MQHAVHGQGELGDNTMGKLIWIIDEEWPEYDLEKEMLYEHYPDCTIKFSTYDYQKDLAQFGKDADAILCQIYASIPKETIAQLDRCKAIAVYGTGFDRVDIGAAKQKGIKVTNVSDYCKEDIADYTMGAIYYFNKSFVPLTRNVSRLEWGAQAIVTPPKRISHSILHVIGLGRIGQEVAKKAIANGMTVTAYDPNIDEQFMQKIGVKKVDWDTGLKHADYISVNFILRDDTVHLIKYEDFQKMKPSAYLINTSRGKIIDEAAMVKALNQQLISGAMVDVIQNEPPTYQEEIFNCPHIYITPHISYVSVQSNEALKRRAINNVIMGMNGQISPDLVNG